MQIAIINGPNLNLLGRREPQIYGNQTFESYLDDLRTKFPELDLSYFQSNHEGALIDEIQEQGFSSTGIVLNAAALSHTSIAIADAVKAVPAQTVEVHISDIFKREKFRHHSYLKEVCAAHFIGYGLNGYQMAIEWLKVQYV